MKTEQALREFIDSRISGNLSPATIEWYKDRLLPFARSCPNLPRRPEPVESFLTTIQGSSETKFDVYRALKTFFRFIGSRHRIPNPMDAIKPPRRPKTLMPTLEIGELMRLLHSAESPRDRAIITLLVDCGARAGEVCSLLKHNIKQVAESMAKGDLMVKDTTILVRIATGPDGYVLTSKGALKLPVWAPAGGALKYYYPVEIALSKSFALVPVDRTVSKNAPITTQPVKAYDDQPGLNIRLLDKAISLGKTHTVVSVDRTYGRNAAVGRDLSILIEGAVSETNAGVQTDETAAARSGALNDMNFNPMTPAAGDKYYFGFSKKFPRMWIYVSTAGVGNWSNVYEYWNGAWVPIVDEVDESSEFQASGIKRIQWTSQADWVQTPILGMNLYWIRSRTTVFNSQTAKPLGAQVFCCLAT